MLLGDKIARSNPLKQPKFQNLETSKIPKFRKFQFRYFEVSEFQVPILQNFWKVKGRVTPTLKIKPRDQEFGINGAKRLLENYQLLDSIN